MPSIQFVFNHVLEPIPSIFLSFSKHTYIFNVQENHSRYLARHHFLNYRVPLNIFFTKADIHTVGGIVTVLRELTQRKFSFKCRLYTHSTIYEYLEDLRKKLGYIMLNYSFFNLQTGVERKGFMDKKIQKEMSQSRQYIQMMRKYDNNFIEKNIDKENQNCASSYIKSQENAYHFEDQNVKIIPFKSGPFVHYIGTLKEGHSGFCILHYNDVQSMKQIISNHRLTQAIKHNSIGQVVHIVEEGSLIRSQQFKRILGLFDTETVHLIYNKDYMNRDQKMDRIHHHLKWTSIIAKKCSVMPDIQRAHIQEHEKRVKSSTFIQQLYPQHKLLMARSNHQFILNQTERGYKKVKENITEIVKERQHQTFTKSMVDKWDAPQFKTEFPKVIFLGTSSTKNVKYRNVSGILLRHSENDCILLDCGQGTYSQLLNHFGVQKIEEVLLSMKVIFITHMHLDHSLGILQMIKERRKILKRRNMQVEKVFLIIPANMLRWYDAYINIVEDLRDACHLMFTQTVTGESVLTDADKIKWRVYNRNTKKLFKCEKVEVEDLEVIDNVENMDDSLKQTLTTYLSTQPAIKSLFDSYLRSVNISMFKLIPVVHCPQSYGISIVKDGVKISYSGDLRPTPEFQSQAKNSALLIHEATFHDQAFQIAKRNFHSTVSEAIQAGINSKSQMTAITHFSTRFLRADNNLHINPKSYQSEKKKYANSNTFMAMDHLEVRIKELESMPSICQKIDRVTFPTRRAEFIDQ